MPKVTDLKGYWLEQAKKAGVDADTLKIFESNEAVLKALSESFKPLPDYSHDLNDTAARAKADKDKEYQDWFNSEKAKYENNEREYQRQKAEAARYKELYGDIGDGNPNPNPNPNPGGTMNLSKEDIEKLIDAQVGSRLSSRDQNYLDLLEIREDHMTTFKKRLDTKAFEDAWKSHPEWGGNMRIAYEKFVQPEAEKIRQADFDRQLQEKYNEGMRDGATRRHMPTDPRRTDFASPGLFETNVDVSKMNDSQQDAHSREAFFAGFRGGDKAAGA